MKFFTKPLSLAIMVLICLKTEAKIISASANGLWTATATWAGGTVPANGDIVVIPAGIHVTYAFIGSFFDDYIDFAEQPSAIRVYGTMEFTNPFFPNRCRFKNAILIEVFSGGHLIDSTPFNSYLFNYRTSAIKCYTGASLSLGSSSSPSDIELSVGLDLTNAIYVDPAVKGIGPFTISADSNAVTYTATAVPTTTIIPESDFTGFTTCNGFASPAQPFTVAGINLTAGLTVTAPTGYQVSTSLGSGYSNSIVLPQSGGLADTAFFVRLTGTGTGASSGNITCVSGSISKSIPLYFVPGDSSKGTWKGIKGGYNNFNNPLNWAGCPPAPGINLTMPLFTNTAYNDSNVTIASLSIEEFATLNNNGSLNITRALSNDYIINERPVTFLGDSLINNGAIANIILSGSSVQTISGTGRIDSLTLNNSSGAKIAAGTTSLYRTFTPTLGTLTTNGNLVLKSSATATAAVAQGSGSISGNVTVERYIPSLNRKKYVLVTSPVNSPSIYNAWQEGGANTNAGYGTQITGAAAGNGFDAASAGGIASIYTYNDANAAGSKWVGLSNTDTNTLGAGTGYLLYVRGDRSENRPVTGNSGNTTLRATGTLTSGTFNTSGLTTGANKYNLIANPYPATIDWLSTAITKTQLSGYFTVYDPNLGVFVTSDGTTKSPNVGQQQARYIQSGQAFFIQNDATGTAPALSITEAAKATAAATATNNTVFGNEAQPAKLSLNVYSKADTAFADGAVAMFDKSYAPMVDEQDATKFANFNETVGFMRNKQLLSIEKRSLTNNDTLFVNLTNFAKKEYQIIIEGSNFIGATATLEDRYTHTKQAIDLAGSTNYSFTINSEAASQVTDRFVIVFGSTAKETPADMVSALHPSLSIYPNPVKDKLQVNFATGTTESAVIKIINGLGQVVKTIQAGRVGTGNIGISTIGLPAGTYTVQLVSVGKNIATQKMVKE